MNKFSFKILISIFLFILLNGCSKPTFIGTTSGNLNNGGLYAQQGDWIYYADLMNDYHLSKMKTDGSEATTLTDQWSTNIIVIGDWIYYSSRSSINRIKITGKDNTQLTASDEMLFPIFTIQNDTIFFIPNSESNTSLYSMKIDGQDVKQVVNQSLWTIQTDGQALYYVSMNNELHKMQPNSQDDNILAKGVNNDLVIDNDWIYYSAANEQNKIYRIKTNGKENTKLSEDNARALNVTNDKLYYFDDNTKTIKMIELTTNTSTTLLDNVTGSLSIINDWLYFSSDKDYGRLYKVKLDGSDFQKAYAFKMVSPDPLGTPAVQGIGRFNLTSDVEKSILQSGEWIYYTHTLKDEQESKSVIRKTHITDGTKTDIFVGDASYLNVLGDWIYFIDHRKADSIARIKVDGSDYGVVLDKPCDELMVKDNWMIFIDLSDNHRLYKIKTDGTKLTKLSDQPVKGINLLGDSIVHTLYDESGLTFGLYQTALDATGTTKISDTLINLSVTDDNYIVFSQPLVDAIISASAIKPDGSAEVELLNGDITLFGVKDGWLYFCDNMNDGSLQRVSIDGEKLEYLMTPGSISTFHFIGDRIIVFNNRLEAYYIMNPDGSDPQIWIP